MVTFQLDWRLIITATARTHHAPHLDLESAVDLEDDRVGPHGHSVLTQAGSNPVAAVTASHNAARARGESVLHDG